MTELKPCLFCKTTPKLFEIEHEDYSTGKLSFTYEVDCECQSEFLTKNQAIENWNRRSPEWIDARLNNPPSFKNLLLKCKTTSRGITFFTGYFVDEMHGYCVFLPDMKQINWNIWQIIPSDKDNKVISWMPLPELPT